MIRKVNLNEIAIVSIFFLLKTSENNVIQEKNPLYGIHCHNAQLDILSTLDTLFILLN